MEFINSLFSGSKLIADPRTSELPFMELQEVFFICLAYILIILLEKNLKLLPKMELKILRIVHNLILTALSLYMCVEMLYQASMTSWYGPIFRGEKGLGMAKVLWLYYISKILEFGDTAIMLFRHSYPQISFLHVYHHVTVLVMWWFNVKYYPGGEAYPSAWLNSFVHFWMYGYYFLSTLGFSVWWKKYITQLQISQLGLFVLQGVSLLFTGAKEFRFIGLINGAYAATLLFLFLNFYKESYKKESKGQKNDQKVHSKTH